MTLPITGDNPHLWNPERSALFCQRLLKWETMAKEPKSERDGAQVKRAPRIEGRHEAMAVDSAGRTYHVTVIDISSGGFRFETNEPFRIGEYVTLRVPRYGDFPTQIIWAVGNEAGGVFLDPIELPQN